MVQWVVGSILHGLNTLSYFSFHPAFHNWYNKVCMCYPVCGVVHIKEPLLLIGNSTTLDGAVAKPLANRLEDTGFARRYGLQSRDGFQRPNV